MSTFYDSTVLPLIANIYGHLLPYTGVQYSALYNTHVL